MVSTLKRLRQAVVASRSTNTAYFAQCGIYIPLGVPGVAINVHIKPRTAREMAADGTDRLIETIQCKIGFQAPAGAASPVVDFYAALAAATYPKVGDTFKPDGSTRAFMFSHEHARTISFVRLVFERPTLRTQGV